jgi:hypothetical protein
MHSAAATRARAAQYLQAFMVESPETESDDSET